MPRKAVAKRLAMKRAIDARKAARPVASPQEIAYTNLKAAVKSEIANIMEYGTEREDFIANGGIKRDAGGNETGGRTHKHMMRGPAKRKALWNSYVAPQFVVPEDMVRQMVQLHEKVHDYKSPNEVNKWKASLEAAASEDEAPEAEGGGRRKRRRTRRKKKRKTKRKRKRKRKRKSKRRKRSRRRRR
tara:strand:- start:562 stop:1122 length:561 start_codon:yes stop_codon:yes gene_type:complete